MKLSKTYFLQPFLEDSFLSCMYPSSSWVWVTPSTSKTHTLKPFKELGLDSQRVKKLASKLHVHSVPPSSMCTLVLSIPDVPFPVLLSTLIRSRFQAKPATLLIPINFPFLFAVEELYGTRYQSGSQSFSLIYVGSGFHCLRSFLFFSFLSFIKTIITALG